VIKSPIPESLKLGSGHMNFLKVRLIYAKRRHELVKEEMKRRNFKCSITIDLTGIDSKFLNDWIPDINDSNILRERIREKLLNKPEFFWRYMRSPLNKNNLRILIDNMNTSTLYKA
jgi:hypothetical protein